MQVGHRGLLQARQYNRDELRRELIVLTGRGSVSTNLHHCVILRDFSLEGSRADYRMARQPDIGCTPDASQAQHDAGMGVGRSN